MRRNKPRAKKPERSQRQSNQDAYDYDLKAIFEHLKKYHDSVDSQTSSEDIHQKQSSQIDSSYRDESKTTSTGGASTNQYNILDGKIQNLSDKNDSAHTDLRRELEGKINTNHQNLETKIDKKLSIQWYSWTIGALAAMVGVIYLLSYSGLITKVDSHEREINNVRNKIETIEEQNKQRDAKIDKLTNKIDTLNSR